MLAAAAAGRRAESAFAQFVAARGFDAVVYANQPVPKLARLPGVASATELVTPYNGQPACACTHPINPSDLFVVSSAGRSPFNLVSGHLPDPSAAGQVLASFTMRQDYGVRIGTVIHVPLYASSQLSAINAATGALPKPAGPSVALRVVGFEATEYEFPSGSAPAYLLYATPAFARTVLPQAAVSYLYFARLRDGAAGLPRFDHQLQALGLGTGSNTGVSSEDAQAAAIEASIHPQAVGWWILAVLAALAGLAVVAQALARQSLVESSDFPTMAALGADRRQLVALGMARNLVVALAGAAGAVVIAVALSPLAPLGEARSAESSKGVAFDMLVLPLGALTVVMAVLALGVWPAVRAARTLRPGDPAVYSRPSAVVAHLAGIGAPPSLVLGVRNALERRSGGMPVPVLSALAATVLAVITLCGTAVFGASLSHLTATPELYGDPFQIDFGPGPPQPALLSSLIRNPAIARISLYAGGGEISVNKVLVGSVPATPVRGQLLFSAVAGHLPSGDSQIGLGAATMRQVGAHVGSVVTVSLPTAGKQRAVPFRVTAQVSFPVIAGGIVSLGTGALITIAGLEHARCPRGPGQAACLQKLARKSNSGILASAVPGPRGQAAISRYLDTYSSIAALPATPTSLINFGEAVDFPLIFGAVLAVFGAATLAHLLLVSVSRRRRETGLLKALGFVNGQIASTVAWQATTVALVGIVAGIPAGVAIGRAIWQAFASNLGAIPVPVVPILFLGGLAGGILVVANIIAVAPALAAIRSKPGELLRTS